MLILKNLLIIIDLQINNGFKGKEFDIFWNKMSVYFNEIIYYL